MGQGVVASRHAPSPLIGQLRGSAILWPAAICLTQAIRRRVQGLHFRVARGRCLTHTTGKTGPRFDGNVTDEAMERAPAGSSSESVHPKHRDRSRTSLWSDPLRRNVSRPQLKGVMTCVRGPAGLNGDADPPPKIARPLAPSLTSSKSSGRKRCRRLAGETHSTELMTGKIESWNPQRTFFRTHPPSFATVP